MVNGGNESRQADYAATLRLGSDIYPAWVIMSANFELIHILRETLYQIEKESDPKDPAMSKLKRAILLAIAELELGKTNDQGAAA